MSVEATVGVSVETSLGTSVGASVRASVGVSETSIDLNSMMCRVILNS